MNKGEKFKLIHMLPLQKLDQTVQNYPAIILSFSTSAQFAIKHLYSYINLKAMLSIHISPLI